MVVDYFNRLIEKSMVLGQRISNICFYMAWILSMYAVITGCFRLGIKQLDSTVIVEDWYKFADFFFRGSWSFGAVIIAIVCVYLRVKLEKLLDTYSDY